MNVTKYGCAIVSSESELICCMAISEGQQYLFQVLKNISVTDAPYI